MIDLVSPEWAAWNQAWQRRFNAVMADFATVSSENVLLHAQIHQLKQQLKEMTPPMHPYSITITWDDGDESFIARCPEFPDLVGNGYTRSQALREIETYLNLAISTYVDNEWTIPTPITLNSQDLELAGGHGEGAL